MPEKKVEEKEEKKYPITISDWLIFLESNVSSNIALYVLLGSFLFALSISIIRLDSSITPISLIYSVVLIIFIMILSVGWWNSAKQIKNYQRLSQKIILEKITDIEEIRKEYEKFKKDI